MSVAKLRIEGFRGIRNGEFVLHQKTAIVGPNGCGKSTIVDALSLVLGKSRDGSKSDRLHWQLADAWRSIHDRGNDRPLLVGRSKRSSRLVP